MENELEFGQPAYLWIGILLCSLLIVGLVFANRRRERDLTKLAGSLLNDSVMGSMSRHRRHVRQGIWLVAFYLLFVCLARPQIGFDYREVKRRGIDMVFAVDTSFSMLAEDVVPNRLERAQLAITDFVDNLEGDRVGLIPFAGNAYSLCPLTLDYGAFQQSLDAVQCGLIPHMGTDISSAVDEANRLFDSEGNNHRILILITDGEDLQGEVAGAVAAAKKKNMTVHCVGVGSKDGALLPIKNGRENDFIRDSKGEPVRSKLDDSTLQEIASSTGGIYVPLGQSAQGLSRIYNEKLRLVPKSEFDQQLDKVPIERFEWPLIIAIILLVVEFLLSERRSGWLVRLQSLLGGQSTWFGRSSRSAVSLLCGLFGSLGYAGEAIDPRTNYNEGTVAYRDGEFEKADAVLRKSLEETTDLKLQQRAYYNLGNTRYRMGEKSLEKEPKATIQKWEQSIKAYEDALALQPDDADAAFNRDFVEKKLEELKQQQEQDQKDQDQKDQDQKDQDQEDKDEEQDKDQDSEGGEKGDKPKDKDEQSEGDQDQSEDGQDGQDGQDGEQGDQEKQEQSPGEGDEDQQNQQNQEGKPDEPRDSKNEAQPKPGEEGDSNDKNNQPQKGEFSEQRRERGQMSAQEAAQLLEALKDDEQSVVPLPDMRSYRRAFPNNTTRGKTW